MQNLKSSMIYNDIKATIVPLLIGFSYGVTFTKSTWGILFLHNLQVQFYGFQLSIKDSNSAKDSTFLKAIGFHISPEWLKEFWPK